MAGDTDDMLRVVTADMASYDVFYKKTDRRWRRLETFIVAASGYAAGCGCVNFNQSSKFTVR